MIGLEAEYLLRDTEGNLVIPSNYGFTTDDFIILGEIHSKPGKTPGEVVGSLLDELQEVTERAEAKKLVVDLTGYGTLSPQQYSVVLKAQGTKPVTECENINGIDILKFSDHKMQDGKVLEVGVSTGLHIHFTNNVQTRKTYTREVYNPVNLPLVMGDGLEITVPLFRRDDKGTEIVEQSVSCNLITWPVLKYIVKTMDDKILPQYKIDVKRKYRQPGFYRVRYYRAAGCKGFEYRSLPFNQKVLDNLMSITRFAFGLLEGLSI